MDIKINPLGNRVAVSSIDYTIQVYNLHPVSGLEHYKQIANNELVDLWKIEFNPIEN